MLNDNLVNYMVKECRGVYNLDKSKLIKKSVEDKKVIFEFKRSDLKLKVEFANDKIAGIIYNNFLTDHQTGIYGKNVGYVRGYRHRRNEPN